MKRIRVQVCLLMITATSLTACTSTSTRQPDKVSQTNSLDSVGLTGTPNSAPAAPAMDLDLAPVSCDNPRIKALLQTRTDKIKRLNHYLDRSRGYSFRYSLEQWLVSKDVPLGASIGKTWLLHNLRVAGAEQCAAMVEHWTGSDLRPIARIEEDKRPIFCPSGEDCNPFTGVLNSVKKMAVDWGQKKVFAVQSGKVQVGSCSQEISLETLKLNGIKSRTQLVEFMEFQCRDLLAIANLNRNVRLIEDPRILDYALNPSLVANMIEYEHLDPNLQSINQDRLDLLLAGHCEATKLGQQYTERERRFNLPVFFEPGLHRYFGCHSGQDLWW